MPRTDADVPRAEYPRPSMRRPDWTCLNGTWEFEVDAADSGLERGLTERPLDGSIVVPFAPESRLSGVGRTDFMPAVWYRRRFTVPQEWAGRRTLLHFGAVDHEATVWVDGERAGSHLGGFAPFTVDLGRRSGTVEIVVRARDPRSGPQARGKQSTRYDNYECLYTRTTGIWQTVWAEPVPDVSLGRPRITPDLAGESFHVEQPLRRAAGRHAPSLAGAHLRVTVSDAAGVVGTGRVRADLDLAPRVTVRLPADRVRTWSPADPHLYAVRVELLGPADRVLDAVDGDAGLRSVTIDGNAVLLNGEPVFLRLVLDQGYYPDGLMTAPSDDALRADIELAMAAGFNGARLHEKVFEERFLHHADRLGYLVWGEFGDWGAVAEGTVADGEYQRPTTNFVTQWLEVLERDYSHPSVIGWCGLNETHQPIGDHRQVLDDVTRAMFLAAKAMDTSRPVLDASGYSHRVPESDVWDSHNYTQDPAAFAEAMSGLAQDRPDTNRGGDGARWSLPYGGQPWFCSEFGGIWWRPDADATRDGSRDADSSWGYGEAPRSEEEFHHRFAGLTAVLLDDPLMFGYCYTQLTDVFQEQNGIYSFDRSEKLDVARIRDAQRRPAACERRG
ncbi:glycoside hydrolase family 2 protein [Pseudonocardia sp. HH130630-07]|uniref:glycoside hydrolase family 2 protein n=1 Tax=Pseudonocardia sp. HH130630-07 TaxID=1690815 RepID=UPI000814C3E6|nr:sugar-binding domain-containing protein [Pseudonocardia sp. HH130630-07]ANY09289.1 beta-galactosidase [Pseudonocardia sp. HH130630-07]